MRYGKLILALSSVAMLVGCSEKQAEISQGLKDIDLDVLPSLKERDSG